MAEDIAILRGLLDGAMRTHNEGVNVLVHGRPGTGKTEFVRALVAACGIRLLEIPCEEPGGGPCDGGKRFRSYRFAQSLLGRVGGDVLLFDEVEDVFCPVSGDSGHDGNASGLKGWVNLALERNPAPTFWVTNHIGSIDPAHLRRFDVVLHMEVPPASVRRAVVDRHAADLLLPEPWRARAARHAEMPPAVVERATKVGLLVCSAAPDLVPHQVVGRVMNHTLAALGCARLPEEDDVLPGVDYRLELLNADCDLGRLREGLRRVGEGRVCLYGPPGTGKTEFGRHVARSLDRPLLVRRASDLLSPYVGVAERNIARMFDEAHRQGAVLLVDEADSLLRERHLAQRSWEVTQVNEMLTQMESFRGVFIASTNLIETLDGAAMRRFDVCVRLGYLGPHQAREMFASLAAALGVVPDELSCAALERFAVLTPGDFASVARGARLDAPESAQALVARLQQACEAKRDGSRHPIGFTA
jgi:AAA+ superfamily predicted ATPase